MTCETNGIEEDNLQLIDFSEEDDYLIAFPFRDSLEDLRLSVSFDDVNGFDHTKLFGGANSQVVERIDHVQSESMEPRRPSFLRKSLAWDSAFFTSAGVLNPEELFMINKGFKRAESNQPSDGNGFYLETLESDLFKYVKPNNIHKLSKRSKVATNIGGSEFGQPNALSSNKTNICSQNKVKSLRAPKSQSLNPQGSKGMTKTSITDPQIIQDKVSSQSKLISSRQTTKAAIEGSDDMKMENKTRKAGLVPDLTASKRSRWGDLSGLPKSTSFTSPTTEKDSKVHRSYDSSSSASSSKPLRRKINPRNTKLPASPSSVHFSLTSICSPGTSPASSIDGCVSGPLSSTSTTHQNSASSSHDAMLASDFQNNPLTPSHKSEERKFASEYATRASIGTTPSSGGQKRKIKSSGLRMPSPKIGFFDEEQPLQPSLRRITQVEFGGQSPSPNENRLNKLRSSNLSPCVSTEICSKVRKSSNGEHDGRKVSPSYSKVKADGQIAKDIRKKKMKMKDEGMKKKQVEESQKENVYSFEDEVNGLSRELEVIDLVDRDVVSEVKVHGQLSVPGTPHHCSRTPLIEKTFGKQ
ncbi:uncharacterized protein LOC112508943 [Cynara cardunculus var. scolymus]|uniref:uncharacterized protein LOC112508943 n=1 Tax=Cynara cardunculus var. scolymus TaxID=59895 RepID=UPI000D626DAB|nr:uncharacterized protein LOC112508943 [Cynara cardunculus var. scolymus]